MISLEDAFNKFLHRLELTTREQKDVSDRHTSIRQIVRAGIGVDRDILSGSYKRYTKTKPLKDVDIFFILRYSEEAWLDRHPQDLLTEARALLVPDLRRERRHARAALRKGRLRHPRGRR